ncbi:MFS transporter [Streptomyces sp. TS71-3]|uniref:MFS transporter n=1 Tax=Streptomyces sp. TS71-3 TaxID=2733862 RepID=UPI001B214B91|nr:MFS transporter [Streptomyces sp. TS71-3]GHJ35716.1 MFS transporter [Streptomyces sp. TS71-3]
MTSLQSTDHRSGGAEPGYRAKRWWLFSPAVVVIWIVGMLDKTGVGVIIADDHFLSDMHLEGKHGLLGLLTTVTLVFYGASMPVWGILIDRFGPRRCAIVGMCFWGLSTLAAALAVDVPMLLVARGALGVAEGFLWPMSNALTARWFPGAERSRAKSVWIGAINVGFAISGFVITGAIGVTDWRGAFGLLTILSLVVCVPTAWFLLHDSPEQAPGLSSAELDVIRGDKTPGDVDGEPGGGGRAGKAGNALLTWPLWVCAGVWITNNIGVYGLASWFPTYLEDEQHISGASADGYIALAFLLCVAVGPLVGFGMDRTGRKAIFTCGGFLLAAVCLLLASTVTTLDVQLAAVIVAIIGIEGFTTLAAQGVLHSFAPAHRMGRAAGIMIGIGNFVGAFGATVMGYLVDSGGFDAAFAFLIAVFLVGGGASYVLHRATY